MENLLFMTMFRHSQSQRQVKYAEYFAWQSARQQRQCKNKTGIDSNFLLAGNAAAKSRRFNKTRKNTQNKFKETFF